MAGQVVLAEVQRAQVQNEENIRDLERKLEGDSLRSKKGVAVSWGTYFARSVMQPMIVPLCDCFNRCED